MSSFWQDCRYSVRVLARAPSFTLVAIVTLGLGIGANTAIFTVVNALLLKPLPYPQSNQLVMVWQDMRARGGPAKEWATPGNFVDWKRASGLFERVAAIQGWQPTLTGKGDPESLSGEQVTVDYFDVLGIRPALGRMFRADEDVPNASRVVILSHALWRRRFGGDAGAIGQSIVLSGEPHEIVGVMPDRFRPVIASAADLWRPRRLNLVDPARGAVILRVVARLRPELTMAQAASAAELLSAQLEKAHPEWNAGTRLNVITLHTEVVGDVRGGLLVLLAAVGFVLLIACANIANLLLARASARSREVAVRLALGAGRRRLVRQLLTESLVLAAAGGAVGVLLGVWGVELLVLAAPEGAPRIEEVGLDAIVLTFALGLTVLTGVIFGVAPAVQATRADVTPGLKEGGRGTGAAAAIRTRRLLIVLEIATALVLLVGSGLLLRTFVRLQAFDLGFAPDRVLAGAVLPPRVAYPTAAQQVAFYDRLLARVSSLPGVDTAALSSVLPLGGDSDMSVLVEGLPPPRNGGDTPAVWYRLVSAEYFKAMTIPIRSGRGFQPGEAAPSVIVSETSARRFWNDQDPIGRRMRFSEDPGAPWFTVVGVAGDVRMRGARGESRSEVYLPYWQFPELGTNVVLKLSDKSPDQPELLAASLTRAVRDVDPNIPVARVTPMSQIVSESIDEPRFLALLVGVFAALAVVLAVVGIYGVISYTVAMRTAEIGVRMALGAGRRDVFALVLGDGLTLTASGILVGLAAAAALSASLESLLFGIEPLDPGTFAAMTAALVAASTLACGLPAWRAVQVDPMAALRRD